MSYGIGLFIGGLLMRNSYGLADWQSYALIIGGAFVTALIETSAKAFKEAYL